MAAGTVTFASRVRAGDEILEADRFVRVTSIQRARGRKPKVGENLDFIIEGGDVVKRNSTSPVRVRRAAT
jgi:hypothetical protein